MFKQYITAINIKIEIV